MLWLVALCQNNNLLVYEDVEMMITLMMNQLLLRFLVVYYFFNFTKLIKIILIKIGSLLIINTCFFDIFKIYLNFVLLLNLIF